LAPQRNISVVGKTESCLLRYEWRGLPCILRATAPFVYVRLHGPDHYHLYSGSYSDDALRWWADRLREWQAQQRDVFLYFNNDGEGNAVRNAATIRALLVCNTKVVAV